MKIRSKMLLSVIIIASVVFISSIGYLTTTLKKKSLENAFKLADAVAKENANLIRSSLNSEMGMARSLANSFSEFRSIAENKREEITKLFLQSVAKENPDFLSVWASWELSSIDHTWLKAYGRNSYTFYRENGDLKYYKESKNTEGDTPGSSYTLIKTTKKEVITDPYWYTYTGSTKSILETSACTPVIENNRFAGLFGFDFELSRYQALIEKIKPFKGCIAMLLSQNSTIVGHTNKDFIGMKFDSIYQYENKKFDINSKVFSGQSFSFTTVDNKTKEEYYATFADVQIGKTENPWSLVIFVPTKTLISDVKRVSQISLYVILIGLFILLLVNWIMAYNITNPLKRTTQVLRGLAKGEIDTNNKLNVNSGDEIEDIGNSVNILIDGLNKTVSFANEIGKGNLNVAYSKLSEGDLLGESLLNMRKSLEHAKIQEDKRKLEDEKMNWATQGVAKFAEILRQNTGDMNEFSYQIISNLVKYISANIGGLFLVNNDNKNDVFFELASCYAYERRKYLQNRVDLGEGLVGRCAKEGETIYLTDIPKDYIHIVSGLGDETPSCLLIVPLKLNDEVYGVVEIASFDPIEKHVIEFIEKIGESIAATISNVKINIRTIRLLDESRVKSEELASQEEEMRQNMEELQATQEESARKSIETDSLVNALNASSYVIEYDPSGRVISVNDAYLELTGQKAKDIVGSHHSENIQMSEKQKHDYQNFWKDLKNGAIRKETNKVKLSGKTYTFIETYSPIFNENHEVVKILKIAHNITDFASEKKEKQ
jgi:methyl-accepting chemotaxis protein